MASAVWTGFTSRLILADTHRESTSVPVTNMLGRYARMVP